MLCYPNALNYTASSQICYSENLVMLPAPAFDLQHNFYSKSSSLLSTANNSCLSVASVHCREAVAAANSEFHRPQQFRLSTAAFGNPAKRMAAAACYARCVEACPAEHAGRCRPHNQGSSPGVLGFSPAQACWPPTAGFATG